MIGSCHCGAVTISVPGRPAFLNACNCSLCCKLGALWGYYPPDEVAIDGTVRGYARRDVTTPSLTAHFCGECATVTHWTSLRPEPPASIGVNGRLFDPAALHGVEVRYGDRRHTDERGRTCHPPTIFGEEGVLP